MEYKASMFNRIVKKDGVFVLYNSFMGVKNILRVPKEKMDKVSRWLTSSLIICNEDSDFLKLLELGYIVPYNFDEKKVRNYRYMKHTMDNRLNLIIHTTKACNFRCSYCYMDFEPQMMQEDIQHGIVNYVTKNIQKFKSVRISWFGGEPLLNMEAIENVSRPLISICQKQKKPYLSIVTTNGYNLTADNINRLIDLHVNHIAVTVDGTRALHDAQRPKADGTPTFDHIISNLLYIRDKIKTRTLTVSIRTNVTKDLAPFGKEYYKFFNDLFGNDHRFSLFIRPVADYGGERVQQMKDSFVQDMSSMYNSLFSLQDGIKYFPNLIDLEIGGCTCTAKSMYKFTIGCDGSVSKCDESLKDPVGILRPDGAMELDESKCADWLLIDHKQECDDCFFSGSCFTEVCPKGRVLHGVNSCKVNFDEIDSLICLAGYTFKEQIL